MNPHKNRAIDRVARVLTRSDLVDEAELDRLISGDAIQPDMLAR